MPAAAGGSMGGGMAGFASQLGLGVLGGSVEGGGEDAGCCSGTDADPDRAGGAYGSCSSSRGGVVQAAIPEEGEEEGDGGSALPSWLAGFAAAEAAPADSSRRSIGSRDGSQHGDDDDASSAPGPDDDCGTGNAPSNLFGAHTPDCAGDDNVPSDLQPCGGGLLGLEAAGVVMAAAASRRSPPVPRLLLDELHSGLHASEVDGAHDVIVRASPGAGPHAPSAKSGGRAWLPMAGQLAIESPGAMLSAAAAAAAEPASCSSSPGVQRGPLMRGFDPAGVNRQLLRSHPRMLYVSSPEAASPGSSGRGGRPGASRAAALAALGATFVDGVPVAGQRR